MSAETRLIHSRLSILELAVTLGNVTKVCRQHGISRTRFYKYKRRFQKHGLDRLMNLSPIHKTHPFTTPPEVVDRILALSFEYSTCDCVRLGNQLKLQDSSVGSKDLVNIR